MAGKVTRTISERFLEKVKISPGCWEWTANKNKKGYGRIWISGRNHFAHRVFWRMMFGEIDGSLRVLHKCDNPSCVRPSHLFLGTLAENIADRDMKKRTARGEKNGNCKLTIDQVNAIRESGESSAVVACKFKIDRTQVNNIRARRQWAT